LAPARQSRELSGTVMSPEGRPVAGASVWLTDGDIREHVVAVPSTTDSGGRFRFIVHDGLTYMVQLCTSFSAAPTPNGSRQTTGRSSYRKYCRHRGLCFFRVYRKSASRTRDAVQLV
jgi:carboxypeptidase family protein